MTIATTTHGRVQGTDDDGILSFKGVPYAAPPVGEYRCRTVKLGNQNRDGLGYVVYGWFDCRIERTSARYRRHLPRPLKPGRHKRVAYSPSSMPRR